MYSLLEPIMGKQIRVGQTGDNGDSGRLVNIQTDYASIWREQQITHYPYAHIKSVSTDVTECAEIVPLPDVALPTTFVKLLETLLMKMVRIENDDGSRTGVLLTVSSDNVSLVVNTKQLTYYPIFQIKNISPFYKIKSENGTETTAGKGNDTQDSDTKKDSASKSTDDKHHHNSNSSSDNTHKTFTKASSNLLNKNLANTMLDRLNATSFSEQSRNILPVNLIQSKKQPSVGISSPAPTLFLKMCSVKKSHIRKLC